MVHAAPLALPCAWGLRGRSHLVKASFSNVRGLSLRKQHSYGDVGVFLQKRRLSLMCWCHLCFLVQYAGPLVRPFTLRAAHGGNQQPLVCNECKWRRAWLLMECVCNDGTSSLARWLRFLDVSKPLTIASPHENVVRTGDTQDVSCSPLEGLQLVCD